MSKQIIDKQSIALEAVKTSFSMKNNADFAAVMKALEDASNGLDAGKTDQETLDKANQLKTALTQFVANNGSIVPTDFAMPTSLIGDKSTPAIPTVLIPKLFAWIKIYGMNALYTMPTSMLDNSVAIQSYIADGLNKLSETVMDNSQLWSAYGLARLNTIQQTIQHLTDEITQDTGGKHPEYTTQLNTASNAFNLENTYYQKNLELCSTTNTGLNQTSSSTTQTQTLNNQNITQGPLAMMQTLVGIWQVIA